VATTYASSALHERISKMAAAVAASPVAVAGDAVQGAAAGGAGAGDGVRSTRLGSIASASAGSTFSGEELQCSPLLGGAAAPAAAPSTPVTADQLTLLTPPPPPPSSTPTAAAAADGGDGDAAAGESPRQLPAAASPPLWARPFAHPSSEGDDDAPADPEAHAAALLEAMAPLPDTRVWAFDPFSVREDAVAPTVLSILYREGLVGDLALPPRRVCAFVEAARLRYWPNPFHNHFHGLHVCQAASMLLHATGAGEPAVLPRLEVFALLLAAFCHDVDHPGVNNAFLSAVEDELAVRYNDQSVLENHHAALTCELIRDTVGGTDLVSHLPPPQRRRVRQVIIASILATDMSRHFGVTIPAIKGLELPLCRPADPAGNPRPELALLKDRDRIHEILLHAADLSAQVLPWSIAGQWGDRIVQEFRLQAALERAADVPPTAHMHNLATPAECAELQIGFCDYVLAPMWRALADVFPVLGERVDALEANSGVYKAMLAADKAEKAARAAADAAAAGVGGAEVIPRRKGSGPPPAPPRREAATPPPPPPSAGARNAANDAGDDDEDDSGSVVVTSRDEEGHPGLNDADAAVSAGAPAPSAPTRTD
jgi:hypothetical protein